MLASSFAEVFDGQARSLLNSFTDEEIGLLQQELQGMSRTTWLQRRSKVALSATAFIGLIYDDRAREAAEMIC